VAESLAAVNERLRASATEDQRAGLAESPLDSYITEVDRGERERDIAIGKRREPSLEAFLPKRGDGIALSAGDIETYLTCPLKYKFARVMRVPQEPTVAQRFGIVVHQVLERWHRQTGGSEADLLALLDQSWRRSGLGDGERERQLRTKARDALMRYHRHDAERDAQTIWLERPFAFRIGPHILRGRVDRVDQLADGRFELIDYKTSFPKTADQLRNDIQLTLYAIGARDAWRLDASTRSYWYVLDDDRVEVPGGVNRDEMEATVHQVAEGILSQEFEPSPSYSACSTCDWRLACPAAVVILALCQEKVQH
jgi:DNA helicase-2/ATP-dependent DNA helicase PcrA